MVYQIINLILVSAGVNILFVLLVFFVDRLFYFFNLIQYRGPKYYLLLFVSSTVLLTLGYCITRTIEGIHFFRSLIAMIIQKELQYYALFVYVIRCCMPAVFLKLKFKSEVSYLLVGFVSIVLGVILSLVETKVYVCYTGCTDKKIEDYMRINLNK